MTTAAEFLRTLPKVQLHCHLEGTLRPGTFLDLARRHGVALRYEPGQASTGGPPADADPRKVYEFEDFQAFLMTFAAVSRSLAQPDDYSRMAREYAEDALAQNVRYAEVFVSPSVWRFFNPDLDTRACVRAIREALDDRRDHLEVKLIVDLTRNFGSESAMQTAQMAVDLQDLGAIGVGLGGDEMRFPAEDFADAFAFARSHGMRCVAHAGEAAGPQSVRAAIDVLGAERIGHGIRAIEDPALVRFLAEHKIPLEICPTSNFLTGVANREQPHALLEFDAAGCLVTIDADDPALFKTSITEEYAYVAELAGLDAVMQFARNAVDASFAPASTKAALLADLEASDLEPGASRRTS